MARGQEAKQRVEERLKEAFGADYIGLVDKKYYVWSEENGEPTQVALTMTCPKVPVGEVRVGDLDFSGSGGSAQVAKTSYEVPEITQEEEDTVIALMKKLGL